MATILLSAAGAAVGGSIGGTVLGVSSAAVGQLAGATLGRVIDQRVMGGGSEVVETRRVPRFRVTGAGEGDPISVALGRIRLPGQVIWTSRFLETQSTTVGGNGKGGRPQTPQVTTIDYSYSVSLAVAVCEGEIGGVARVWVDGQEISMEQLNMRIYHGTDDQLPDGKIEAIEGTGQVPAYRGIAYVVIEDLPLGHFGNRVPQFAFEVLRPDFTYDGSIDAEPAHAIQAVAMIPGTGDYALSTDPAMFDHGLGRSTTANVNSVSEKTDLLSSLDLLEIELPNVQAASLIVSWFGDDLRCGVCSIRPRVEQNDLDAVGLPWTVAGVSRAQAGQVATQNGVKLYGGTPSDLSVMQSIQALKARGKAVMFYPFILMEPLPGNQLPDPYSDDTGQPQLPWRGRITTSIAPGRDGSPDKTTTAEAEVAAFFGTASASDFSIQNGQVLYSGPSDWRYRRFILHNAALCAAAGGVDSFCIGSEMRGLTQIRGAAHRFPAVEQLRSLATEVRQILGPHVKIGYAADWTEYFGYHPQDGSGDVYFHLDPLWADKEIDFVGIDNYMPLSDWRDETDHADVAAGSIYNLNHLRSNVEGGEGFDWYYSSAEARAAQRREDITDGAYDEPWVFRYKDIRNWWSNAHHNRIAGERAAVPTAWEPQSKPIFFTEIGCAAINKGTNQPNRFIDPKSSESGTPYYSDGRRDEFIQMQYLRALIGYWAQPGVNPVSSVYGGTMLDMSQCFVWAWDARPFPAFPRNKVLWNDGDNYRLGHWMNGRGAHRSLGSVVREICARSGVRETNTDQLYGLVRGYDIGGEPTARAALQVLMLQYGFDALERGGELVFRTRQAEADWDLDAALLVHNQELPHGVEALRAADTDRTGRVRLNFLSLDEDYQVATEEAALPDDPVNDVSTSDAPLVLTRAEARQTAERWLNEARVARDGVRMALPPSAMHIGVGDVVRWSTEHEQASYRVERVEYRSDHLLDLVKVDSASYAPLDIDETDASQTGFVPPAFVLPYFLDLPLLTESEAPHAPHLALTASPWPATVATYSATTDGDFTLLATTSGRATMGHSVSPLLGARSGVWDLQNTVTVELAEGSLESRTQAAVLDGANLAAIGDGSPDGWELIQFTDAELIAHNTYILRGLLRGQRGTEGQIADFAPSGSAFVVLNPAVTQLDLPAVSRNIARRYRIGSARRSVDDPSFVEQTHAFAGIGLRPYAPVHLRADVQNDGAVTFRWTRRSRVGADSWDGLDVPLGEESETYRLRVVRNAQVLREVFVSDPAWTYHATDQTADGGRAGTHMTVAQISTSFGAGAEARIDL